MICFAAAGLGASATGTSVGGWYQTIRKPSWNPPDRIFGPVWTVLYLMMSVAAWLVWRRGGWKQSRNALVWFGIQLALNSLWSIVLFGLRQPGWGFVEIVFLWLAIAVTAWQFRSCSFLAAILMLPYLAWTTFAVFLNLSLWRMNS